MKFSSGVGECCIQRLLYKAFDSMTFSSLNGGLVDSLLIFVIAQKYARMCVYKKK